MSYDVLGVIEHGFLGKLTRTTAGMRPRTITIFSVVGIAKLKIVGMEYQSAAGSDAARCHLQPNAMRNKSGAGKSSAFAGLCR